MYKPKQGDVVETKQYGHCKDGVAIVSYNRQRREHEYHDTYWHSQRTQVFPDPSNITLLFNLGDVREVTLWEYDHYAVEDKYQLRSQHGYSKKYYVKKSAKESIKHQLTEAYLKQHEKKEAIDSAVSSYEWATREVVRLEGLLDKENKKLEE